jgi:MOSC domain-containing protein YiiM
VLCEGVRLCEPCAYLDDLIAKPVLLHLLRRGGLRADVLEDGEIRIGDEVRAV